jgi:hypothetical protein
MQPVGTKEYTVPVLQGSKRYGPTESIADMDMGPLFETEPNPSYQPIVAMRHKLIF